jgi:hypothetical protein
MHRTMPKPVPAQPAGTIVAKPADEPAALMVRGK